MGRKKRGTIKKVVFCYYCDREFDDEKVLIQHQKAKHFKCGTCGKKMTTVSSLTVHIQSVHKQPIKKVPNAISGRDDLDVEVYGMEGVPEEIIYEKMNPGAKRPKTMPPNPGAQLTRPVPAHVSAGYGATMGAPSAPYGSYGVPPPHGQPPVPGLGQPPVSGTGPPPPQPPPPPMHGSASSQSTAIGTPPGSQPPYTHPSAGINPMTSPGAMGNGMGSALGSNSAGYTSLSVQGGSSASISATATSANAGVTSNPTKKNVLVYDDEKLSPEEKRAQLPRYRYDERQLSQEWEALSQDIQNKLAQYTAVSSST